MARSVWGEFARGQTQRTALAVVSLAFGLGLAGCGAGKVAGGEGGRAGVGGGGGTSTGAGGGGTNGGGANAGPDGGATDGAPPNGGVACVVADPATGAPALVSPANGSTLKATSVDFAWTPGAGATDYRLTIGTTPGGAELFQSPPLGAATSLTVSGLPLTGQPVYVDLQSQTGTAGCTITRAQYAAAVRKGLAVVADFADARLEDWTGPGMRSLADVRQQLDLMQEHWDFLSRGIEKTPWDVTRVTLAQPLAADAFPGFIDYRRAVAQLLKGQIKVEDYDVNSDGVIDGVWIIASDNGKPFGYMTGGFTQIDNVNIFVDTQDSLSVVEQQTGNFNHEFGHCLGLPDLYGAFSTLGDLTLMDSSWNFPREDFCAFDRTRLGWAKPRVITMTTAAVLLRSANDTMDAVKVPLADPDEYFLLEYKQKPAAGFGSAGARYNGIVVYHVLEGASQNVNPPLLKVEPADGTSAFGPPELTDLFYPGNSAMTLPVVLRSYFGGQPVLQIDGVRWGNGGIEVDLEVPAAGPIDLGNLLANPGFETGTAPWTTNAFQSDPALVSFTWTSPGRISSHSVLIDAPVQPNDADWRQPVTGLTPGTGYRLCGWIKGENIVPFFGATVGGTIGVAGTFNQSSAGFGSYDWTRRCVSFNATADPVEVGCRLGGFGSVVTGKLWCDDLELSAVRSAF